MWEDTIAAPGLLEESLCLTCFFNTWGKGCHVQLLLTDFSSAFNTIQRNIWIQWLLEHFDLSNNLVGWILDFSTNRTLRVWVDVFLCASLQLCHKAIIYPLSLVTMCCSTFKVCRWHSDCHSAWQQSEQPRLCTRPRWQMVWAIISSSTHQKPTSWPVALETILAHLR